MVARIRLSALHRIVRFHEKPPPPLAASLLARGALWNTLVLVAHASTLLGLIQNALPDAVEYVAPLRMAIGTAREAEMIEQVYRMMPATDFSSAVLVRAAGHSLVLPVRDVSWSDLGRSERVLATLSQLHAPSADRIGVRGPAAR
jgi:mannose-1-phosphate guanylyltransferase